MTVTVTSLYTILTTHMTKTMFKFKLLVKKILQQASINKRVTCIKYK